MLREWTDGAAPEISLSSLSSRQRFLSISRSLASGAALSSAFAQNLMVGRVYMMGYGRACAMHLGPSGHYIWGGWSYVVYMMGYRLACAMHPGPSGHVDVKLCSIYVGI